MIWIEYHDPTPVRQRVRTSTAGPFFGGWSKQALARCLAQVFNLIKINYQKICELCEAERIKRGVGTHAGKISKTQGLKLESSPLIPGR